MATIVLGLLALEIAADSRQLGTRLIDRDAQQVRDARTGASIDMLRQDVRYALRPAPLTALTRVSRFRRKGLKRLSGSKG